MSAYRFSIAGFVVFTVSAFGQTQPLASWVQLGPGGQIIARVVLDGTQACPQVTIPGAPLAMRTRGAWSTTYPVTVCEAVIPAAATSATVNGISLPLPNPKSAPAVIGDTGCRGNTLGPGKTVQPEEDDDDLTPEPAAPPTNCATSWPLGQLATTLAGRRQPPGLVIHVGDYIYIHEKSWESWRTQFFAPVKPLLAKSAWLFVRGNHETCLRHGPGYFRFLDPRPYDPANCSDATDPYLVPFGKTPYVVLDSSGATCDFAGETCSGDTKIKTRQEQVTTWTELIKAADKAVPQGSAGVLLTHRPVWGAKAEKLKTAASTCGPGKGRGMLALNSVLEDAWNKASTKRLSIIVSGHTHTWEFLVEKDQRPQLIAGNSGVTRTHPGPPSAGKCNIATTKDGAPYLIAETLNGLDKWGFTILDTNQKLTAFDPKGHQLLSCTIVDGKKADCTPPASHTH